MLYRFVSQKVNFYVHVVWFKHSWSLFSIIVMVHFNIIHLPMPMSVVSVPFTLPAWILCACCHPDVYFMSLPFCSPRLGCPNLNDKGLRIMKLLIVCFYRPVTLYHRKIQTPVFCSQMQVSYFKVTEGFSSKQQRIVFTYNFISRYLSSRGEGQRFWNWLQQGFRNLFCS